MLIYSSKLIGTPVFSVQTGAPVGYVAQLIVNPDNLKIIAFRLEGGIIGGGSANLLDVSSVREYSDLGIVIDDAEELVVADDVVRLQKVIALNFDLIGLKVETKKGSKLGKVVNYTLTSEDFMVQQVIVKRPTIKALIDPELTIARREIVEITDYKIIVKDEEKTLKKRAEKEDFIPNFVNPFRKTEAAQAKEVESEHE